MKILKAFEEEANRHPKQEDDPKESGDINIINLLISLKKMKRSGQSLKARIVFNQLRRMLIMIGLLNTIRDYVMMLNYDYCLLIC